MVDITVLIITYNEELNIKRTLDSVSWAKRIIIVDSFSEDATLKIIAEYKQAIVYQSDFVDFASQCNYGITKVESTWVLSIDADYYITEELKKSIETTINKAPKESAFLAGFKYVIFGKPLKGSVLPDRPILFKKLLATYIRDGHAHKLSVDGDIGKLKGYVHHDDRKPLSSWLKSQDKYSDHEKAKLLSSKYSGLERNDKIRRNLYFAPVIMLFYCLFFKGGIFDGKRGWYYALQRTYFEILLSLRLTEHSLEEENIEGVSEKD